MENIIKSVTAKALQVNQEDVKVAYRLMGGMSNFTFVIEVKGEKYTFRIPGKNAHVFVDRVEEAQNIEKIEALGINNETVYLDTEAGYKIAKFVEGLSLGDSETPEAYLQDVADVLKTLHHANIVAAKDYQPYERLESYELLVNDLNHSHDPRYYALKEEFLSNREFLDQCPKVFCHNDSQISNIVVESDQTYLLDWEFGGNNDPLYDAACVGNKDFDLALKFLPVYLGREPKDSEYKRLYLWRAFQCLQWHNVAMYKELIGLSAELGVNFKFVAGLYLDKAQQFLNDAKPYQA